MYYTGLFADLHRAGVTPGGVVIDSVHLFKGANEYFILVALGQAGDVAAHRSAAVHRHDLPAGGIVSHLIPDLVAVGGLVLGPGRSNGPGCVIGQSTHCGRRHAEDRLG